MYGLVTTPTGGQATCHRQPDGRWMWTCDACGAGALGTETQARTNAADHLRTRALCSHR
jgi:hypothetical protein